MMPDDGLDAAIDRVASRMTAVSRRPDVGLRPPWEAARAASHGRRRALIAAAAAVLILALPVGRVWLARPLPEPPAALAVVSPLVMSPYARAVAPAAVPVQVPSPVPLPPAHTAAGGGAWHEDMPPAWGVPLMVLPPALAVAPAEVPAVPLDDVIVTSVSVQELIVDALPRPQEPQR